MTEMGRLGDTRAHGPFRLGLCSSFPFPMGPVSSVLHMVHELLILFSVVHPLPFLAPIRPLVPARVLASSVSPVSLR